MNPGVTAGVITASAAVLTLFARGVHWGVSQITGALDAIRGELNQVRLELEHLSDRTITLSEGLTDHEGRLRSLERPVIAPPRPLRKGKP